MSASFNVTLSLAEVTDLVQEIGEDVTVIVRSEPGVGKSSILTSLAERVGDKYTQAGDSLLDKCRDDKYDYIYVDCPSKELYDIAGTIPNHAEKKLEYYMASLAHMDSPRPKIIMLDEYSKIPRTLKVIFTRMMLEKTWGDVPLPKGTKIFATANNTTDGLGDTLEGHELNRCCVVEVGKSLKDWLRWAVNHGISPILLSAATHYGGTWFASYRDQGQEDNPRIFNPKRRGQSFLSPRSLAKCNAVVERFKGRDSILQAALNGMIGQSAAAELIALIKMNSQVHTTAEIIRNPRTIDLPTDDAALFLILFNAIPEMQTQDDLSAFMEFVNRIDREEIQAVFYAMMFRSKAGIKLARGNEKMRDWSIKNYELIG